MSHPIKAYTIAEIEDIVRNASLPSFRAWQILTWIYAKSARDYENMTNLPKVIREQFALAFPLQTPSIAAKQESRDGSRKYLLEYADGTTVETVGLPSNDGRLTVCCSSQAGCSMACSFCATGKQGLSRNLDPGEIVDQVLVVQEDFSQRVTNVVVMGQGEPFANYDAVLGALRIMNHPKLLNIGSRHITVSTCGIIDGIERFSEEEEQFTLAVSLHSARQELRDEIMPAMKNQRLGTLRSSLDQYSKTTGRRFSLEYALMEGVNDSQDDLDELVSYCRRLLCHVNLIPLNEVEGSPYHPVPNAELRKWRDHLEQHGISASIRLSRASDISAACGQLLSSRPPCQ